MVEILEDRIVNKLVEEFGFDTNYDIHSWGTDEITFCGGDYDFNEICDFICDNFDDVKDCEFYYEVDGGIVMETRIELEKCPKNKDCYDNDCYDCYFYEICLGKIEILNGV